MSEPSPELLARLTAEVVNRGGKQRGGTAEYRFRCPSGKHDDAHPSCDWNADDGVWNCLACGAAGGAIDLAELLGVDLSNGVSPTPASPRGHGRNTGGGDAPTPSPAAATLPSDEQWAKYQANLANADGAPAEKARDYLAALGIDPAAVGWGLSSLTPERALELGLSPKAAGMRLLIPVRDARGRLLDVRRYTGPFTCTDSRFKCVPWRRGTGTAAAYGWHDLPPGDLIWCEGEKDREALCALGFTAVSHTNGANAAAKVARGLPDNDLAGRRILVWFDRDDGGDQGAARLAEALRERGVVTAIATWPEPSPKGFDFSDAILRDGPDAVRELVRWNLTAADWTDPPAPLPAICVADRQLSEVTDEAISALRGANDPPELFVRSGKLVRIVHDETGWPSVAEISGDAIRGRLARVARWVGSKQRPVHPPTAVAQTVLSEPTLPLPGLEAICQTPTLRPDGSVLSQPGYDPATQLFYAPPRGLSVPAVPQTPTAAECRSALEQLHEVLADFPFIDEASYANLLALWLTPVIRGAIDGPVPMAIIDAPSPGTGKSLLVEAVAICVTGRATFITAPGDEDEWRKRLTALILGGASIVAIDNIPRRLASDQLSAALTAAWWEDRELGRSGIVRMRQRATWVATGNNISLGGDLPRRCYWIRLDAGVSRPWERDRFRIANLRRHVSEHRGELLAALLTLARAWVAEGRPKADTPKLGGFEHWLEIVGGALAFVGVAGFLGNQTALYEESDEDGPTWEAFIRAWYRCFHDKPMRTAEVINAMHEDDVPAARDLRECLPPWAVDAVGHPDARKLGNSFKRYLNRRFGTDGIRLCRHSEDGHAKVVRWCVKTDAGSAGSAGQESPQRGNLDAKSPGTIYREGLDRPRVTPQTPQDLMDPDYDPFAEE